VRRMGNIDIFCFTNPMNVLSQFTKILLVTNICTLKKYISWVYQLGVWTGTVKGYC